jgi:25S rRNA (uracil2843-N3)-methyltransferase
MPPKKSQSKASSRSAKSSKPSSKQKTSSSSIANQDSDDGESSGSDPRQQQRLKDQQRLLSIIQGTFDDVLSSTAFTPTLQAVKAALYDRDFDRAFGREDYLRVYAARWSPTRALAYATMLEGLAPHLEGLLGGSGDEDEGAGGAEAADGVGASEDDDEKDELRGEDEAATGDDDDAAATHPEPPAPRTLRMLAIGGGVAELAAFASFLSFSSSSSSSSSLSSSPSRPLHGDLTLVDTGPWGSLVSALHPALTTAPPLSRYANAAARAANRAVVGAAQLGPRAVRFRQQDVLGLRDGAGLLGEETKKPVLITLLFTLNELYNSSGGRGIARTTALLRALSAVVPAGSLLLVVDSPGSYSEAAVGKGAGGGTNGGGDGGEEKQSQKKRYPMHWLLDHTLLTAIGGGRRKSKRTAGSTEQQQQENERRKEEGQEDDQQQEKREGEQSDEKGQGAEEEQKGCRWEKLEENASVWFRVPEELRYPIPLENMRYQIHLYRAIPFGQEEE